MTLIFKILIEFTKYFHSFNKYICSIYDVPDAIVSIIITMIKYIVFLFIVFTLFVCVGYGNKQVNINHKMN